MSSRINHQPTDRNKARWKSWALLALVGFWLVSGIAGRDPWKPDEPVFIGILQSLLDPALRGSGWRPLVAGLPLDSESILIHWFNAPVVIALKSLLPLHEAARVVNVLWTALGIAALFSAARRWSGGHISYLAAIIAIGCVGLYDRAHGYGPDIPVFTAVAIALYGCACLASATRRATLALSFAIVLAFAARSVSGFAELALPVLLLCFAPVYSAHRLALIRALVFATVVCALWLAVFAARDAAGFAEWFDADFGLKLEDRNRFGPTAYLGTLLWFAWPAWPVAVWLLTLRARGFGGGWQRGEVIAPVVFFTSAFAVVCAVTEPRAVFALGLLPPVILLAAFGVDTLKRTWYALIDWFGILVLGLTAIAVVLVGSSIYFGWPPMIAQRITAYVPDFTGQAPWFGYGVVLLAFLIWIALIQPAHQHARRAMINWAGCVTFLWIVAQALLITPANHIMSYRGVFTALDSKWPTTGCVNSVELSTSQAAMLQYLVARRTQPVDEIAEATCPHVLLQRYRDVPPAPESAHYTLRFRGNRPGDNAEAFELYERVAPASAAVTTATPPAPPAITPDNKTDAP